MNIFVFGSNLAGRHGAGAAKTAVRCYGAIYGQGRGLQGSSYAIPTKDENIRTLPLERIKPEIHEFIKFAKDNPQCTFEVTNIGCGLAGYDVTRQLASNLSTDFRVSFSEYERSSGELDPEITSTSTDRDLQTVLRLNRTSGKKLTLSG